MWKALVLAVAASTFLITPSEASCGGDPNAEPGCGVNCGRLCSDYDKGPGPCPDICLLNGCDCKEGFVFDDNIKKCVRPKDCTPVCGTDECPTPICGKNEVYDTCANGGCDKRDCSQVDQPGWLCIDPIKCIGGCVCQKGFLRADDGICVPEYQCPQKCPKPHEIYDPCPPTCPPQTCDSIGKIFFCPAIIEGNCKGACRCKQGFYRNSIGECISEKHCLQCTGANEIFDPCPPNCPPQTCDSIGKIFFCPLIPANKYSKDCHGACRCKPNYLRNKTGKCIAEKDCPQVSMQK